MALLQVMTLILLWNAQTERAKGFVTHKQFGPPAEDRQHAFTRIPRKSTIPNPKGGFTGRSKIIHWTFYARSKGYVYLQVWRKQSGNMYMLISTDIHYITRIGKNIVPSRFSRSYVAAGDVIGFYTAQYNLIPYDNVPCKDGHSPTIAATSSYNRPYSGATNYFTRYTWSRKACRLYSLNVLVETSDKLTGKKDQAYGFDSIHRPKMGYNGRKAYIPNARDRVVHDGQLVKWQFYAKRLGQVYLQIWNNTNRDTFRLLYQTKYNVKRVGLNIVAVSDPVLIRKGSVMGFYNPSRSIIPYTTYSCYPKTTLVNNNLFLSINWIYSFKEQSLCRKYSIWMQLTKENESVSEYGNAAVSRLYKDLATNRVLIPQPHQSLPTGRLMIWEMYAATPGEIFLQIWRPTNISGSPNSYRLVGQTKVYAKNSGVLQTSVSNIIMLEKGDAIGIYFQKKNIIPFSGIACSKPGFLYVQNPRHSRLSGHLQFTEQVIWNKCRAYSVKVKVLEKINDVSTTSSTMSSTGASHASNHVSTSQQVTGDYENTTPSFSLELKTKATSVFPKVSASTHVGDKSNINTTSQVTPASTLATDVTYNSADFN